MGQAPTGVFAKASEAPTVDGVVDAVWEEATANNIDKPVLDQTPSIGLPGESFWKGLWTKEGVYILLDVKDNAFLPNYLAPDFVSATTAGFENYNWDKFELYFDVNYSLPDGGAPGAADATLKPGHYQVAPGFILDEVDGTPNTNTDDGVINAFMVDGSHYIAEYFVPFTKLLDSDGFQFDKMGTIGFDVTVIDRDPGDLARNQAVWSNQGANGENWTNMDDAGQVTFADADAIVFVDEVTLESGQTITTDNGTLQMVATITPDDATIQVLKWSVENLTGKATIDKNGLLKAITNGTVSVKAASTDGYYAEAMVDVEITGQETDRNDIWNSFNLIKNWNFDTDITSWSGWYDGTGQIPPVVTEGVVAMNTVVADDGQSWHYQFNQSAFTAEANVPYVLKFKSWSAAERTTNHVDFEDTGDNGNNRYGATTDLESGDGRSEWTYTTTTEATWFTFHVTFDQLIESTVQKVQWMESLAEGTVYLDSVLLVTQEEYDLLLTLPATGVKSIASSINRVYPSPVGSDNALYVELSSVNTNIAIYNTVGQKMMEKVSTGTTTRFDVSSLRHGMYFVKLGDGSTQKFIR